MFLAESSSCSGFLFWIGSAKIVLTLILFGNDVRGVSFTAEIGTGCSVVGVVIRLRIGGVRHRGAVVAVKQLDDGILSF